MSTITGPPRGLGGANPRTLTAQIVTASRTSGEMFQHLEANPATAQEAAEVVEQIGPRTPLP